MSVFFLHESHATHRWIRFGGLFTFQPSEIAKPAMILFLPWFLHTRLDQMRDWQNTLLRAALIPVVFILLVVKEPDLGTALVLAGITAFMLVLAGMEWKYLGSRRRGFASAARALLFWVPWRRARMLVFLHPEPDPQGAGFHINQSLIAVGTGGFSGRGYMEGMQKLFYLPEAHTDFIFANIAEELGFIGAMFIVVLFVVFGVIAGCARPFALPIRLPASPLSALRSPFCCRPSSTSAWFCRWCPLREFRCRLSPPAELRCSSRLRASAFCSTSRKRSNEAIAAN